MPWETPDEEVERLEGERRRYELQLAATPESERDRRAHLQEWADRRTAEIDKLYDRRPLDRWDRLMLGTSGGLCAVGSFAVDSSWSAFALSVLALLILSSLSTGFLVHVARRVTRRLTRRTHWDKAP